MTGVTVGLLAIGLFAAGIGTMAFLRNTLILNLDEQLRQLAPTDQASSIWDIQNDGGILSFTPYESGGPSEFFIAIYDQTGDLIVTAGPDDMPEPVFPQVITLEWTAQQGTTPFELNTTGAGAPYHASVDYLEVPAISGFYTQLVAMPVASTERVVATYVGIYGIIALLILIASAILTRWLVTLTFRGLGQVEATAMSIAAGDFSQRLPDVVPGTEVGRLKAAINAMLNRIDGALGQRDATVRQMRRFIGDASHELRTPLVTVRGYAELYRMGAIRSDEDTAQAMERIEKEAMRMGVLVEDLLALARLDERRDVQIVAVDLRPLARDAAMDLRAASPHRAVGVILEEGTITAPPLDAEATDDDVVPSVGGRWSPRATTAAIAQAGSRLTRRRRRPRTDAEPDDADTVPIPRLAAPMAAAVAPVVMGDENRIRQVIANLLGNARRFTPDDSPIELRVGSDGDAGFGWVEVIDHGEGIPEQIRDQIFQRFWRADTSRTRETGGSGLGLSIVASIIDTLGGHVDVSETPGGGATFRVSIPLAADAARDQQD